MRRGERRPGGPEPEERLLPTLNAVLMPATTGLPSRLQRRTCSQNRFPSFSPVRLCCVRSLRLPPLSPSLSKRCFRRALPYAHNCNHSRYIYILHLSPSFSFARFSSLPFLFSPRSGLSPPSVRVPLVSLPFVPSPFLPRSFARILFSLLFVITLLPARFRDLFARVLLSSALPPCLALLLLKFLFLFLRLSRISLRARTHTLTLQINTFSPYCRSRGRCIYNVSFTIYLSIEEIARGEGGVPPSKEGKCHPLPFPRPAGISHGFGLRTAVDLIAGTCAGIHSCPRFSILDFRRLERRRRSATASAIDAIANQNSEPKCELGFTSIAKRANVRFYLLVTPIFSLFLDFLLVNFLRGKTRRPRNKIY